jgi:hypothetical protein
MPNGRKCHSIALRGKPYCYFHIRLHRPAKAPRPSVRETFKLPELKDRSAIQMAVAQVFNALGSSKMDSRHAGLFLYGLQIASQNADSSREAPPPREKVENEDLDL